MKKKSNIYQSIDETVLTLVFQEPFYGHILQSISRGFSKSIKTAAVSINNNIIKLIINEDYFRNELNENERVAVIKHEVLHLVFKHLFRNKKYQNKRYLYNVAADLVVNQYIGKWKLPDNAVTLDKFPDLQLEGHESLEYYIEELSNIESNQIEIILENLFYDSHSFWDDNDEHSGFDTEITSCKIDRIIVDSFDKASNQSSFGNLPNDVIQQILKIKLSYRTNIDWRRSLRLFSQNSIRSNVKLTYKRTSKRFNIRPGIKINKSNKLLLAIDTSGSISEEELMVFFSEIQKIYNAGAEIDILECDAKVQEFYKFNGKIPNSVNGRGGTDFDPVFQFLNESKLNYDGCIYLTDGYGPKPLIKSKTKLLWVVNSDSETSHLINGKVIKLIINE